MTIQLNNVKKKIKDQGKILLGQLTQEFKIHNRILYHESEIDITIPSFIIQSVNEISQICRDTDPAFVVVDPSALNNLINTHHQQCNNVGLDGISLTIF